MKWKAYPKYKESDIVWLGEIPEHWKIRPVKHVSGFYTGWTPPTGRDEYFEGENLWANISDLGPKVLMDTANRISDNAIRESRLKLSPKGSLLFSFKLSIGQVSIAGTNMFTNEAIATFLPGSNMTLSYLYWAAPVYISKNANENIYGAKLLNQELIRNAKIVVPPPGEQIIISAFLDRETDRIDTLIAKKERQIELLQEKRAALISQSVTKGLNPNAKMKDSGIEWLGEIPEHWDFVPLKFVVVPRGDAVKTGPFGSQLLSSEMLSGPVKVYNQRNVLDRDFQSGENYITDEKYTELRAFTIYSGDLLITTRGTIGHCALFPVDAEQGILHPCLMRVQPDSRKIIPEYLALLIQDSFLVKTQLALTSNATTIEVIYSDSLKRVKVPLPPVVEQNKILSALACKVGDLDHLTEIVERSINTLRECRTALISAAVTGKIDVRKEVSA